MSKIQRVLVTGGAGFIGSHTCVELLDRGYDVICADNFSNSSPEVIKRIECITGRSLPWYKIDFCSQAEVESLFAREQIDAAIHFAGLKAIGESLKIPLDYYETNLMSLITLAKVMGAGSSKNLVFSSSATVYGHSESLPLKEETPLSNQTPYGRTKIFIEQILEDMYWADREWNISVLRYFNPVGAHPSGLIGEDPNGLPNNLMPNIAQVAAGRLPGLKVFGGDYPTPDGTCIRDYIHVVDLARGHTSALCKLEEGPGHMVHNLGTGRGYSVLDLVNAFERVNAVRIPYEIVARRPGDVAVNYASTEKARKELAWDALFGIEDMVRDTWNWQSGNPDGYAEMQP